jgi:hypothetical protein
MKIQPRKAPASTPTIRTFSICGTQFEPSFSRGDRLRVDSTLAPRSGDEVPAWYAGISEGEGSTIGQIIFSSSWAYLVESGGQRPPILLNKNWTITGGGGVNGRSAEV